MKRAFSFLLLIFFLLTSCNPSMPMNTGATLRVQHTAAAAPFLADLSACADQAGVMLQPDLRLAAAFDLTGADLALRLGDPGVTSPAYQIGADEILVIVNRQNPAGPLSADDVRGLFSGRIQNWKEINGSDAPVQVWVFPSGEDVQQAFVIAALDGGPVTPAARLAMTPDEMSQAVASDVNAVGILTRRWKAGNVTDVYTAASVPALILVPSEMADGAAAFIACAQK
ncbi:MAG: phosphate transport system substrate-binding protein [Anaerolineaceae bacterium]|nr:MAG: phosphate transport system substrate-binding protein [Anaerolineaceae bacterium]